MAAGKKKSQSRKKPRVDWRKARRLYERDGKNFTEIAEKLGCRIETVSAHAKREGWIDPEKIARETAPQRAQEILRRFIDRDADAIRSNLAKKHELAGRLLRLAEGHVARLEEGLVLIVRNGPSVVSEDPLMSLRRLGLVLQNVEAVDRSLAGLKDDGWRSAEGGSGGDSGAEAAAVRAALEEAERG